MEKEHLTFQTEAKQLLDLMIHSVYSNRDIFLRELISNASDALDKRRIELAANPDLEDQDPSEGLGAPEIRIDPDEKGRTLSVSDNGVGMNREELKEYIGTIAKSGTREYLEALKSSGGGVRAEALIGQFGVGFYSAFMVAERVDVVTRRLGEREGWKFSSSGDGTYTIEPAERREPGTTVLLHLKGSDSSKGDREYTDEWTIREIVRKYSDFVTYPIVMAVKKTKEGKEEVADETLNSGKPIWRRSEKDVSEEEYDEFYKHISHDWENPLLRVVFSVEGGTEFRGVLFVPSRAPFDLHFGMTPSGVNLYIRNVFIMNDCKELVPSWLRFLRGVVDSEDLPLNISREMLQEDPLLRIIRKGIVRRVLNALKKLMADDREKYLLFWKEFGAVLKEGLVSFDGSEGEHRDALLDLCLFSSTARPGKLISLKEYQEERKEGQEQIYYLTGRKEAALRTSPLLERCASGGENVLLLTDPVDEVIAPSLTTWGGMEFRSLERVDALPAGTEGKKNDQEQPEDTAAFLREVLKDVVKEVRFSDRLTTSPACLVNDREGGSMAMEQLLRSMGRDVPAEKRILEINPASPLIGALGQRLASADAEERKKLEDYGWLLYDQSLLAGGGQIENPGEFARRVADLMTLGLKGRDVPEKE